jgi:DNA-binding LacI/PurR family transcriptional regulator
MATISDVAHAAGVSISTVSYALSGKRSISATTRQRVIDAVRELDYEPNAGARMLAGAPTNILALSAPMRADVHLPTHMRFVTSVIESARANDYDVLLLATDDEVHGIRRVASRSLVDGVVVMGVTTEDERVELVRQLGIATAFIGIPPGVDDLSCVDLDFDRAARDAVAHLARAGHRSIGMIGHPHSYIDRDTDFIRRFNEGFEAACAEAGITSATQWPSLGKSAARDAFDALRAELPTMTALVFHCNEPIVEAVLTHITTLGLSIPSDLSVLAACASYSTEDLSPPLSTIPLPLDEMCSTAVANALGQVTGRGTAAVALIAPAFVDRGSTSALHISSPPASP